MVRESFLLEICILFLITTKRFRFDIARFLHLYGSTIERFPLDIARFLLDIARFLHLRFNRKDTRPFDASGIVQFLVDLFFPTPTRTFRFFHALETTAASACLLFL